jgi:hypothetical protein
MFSCKTAFTLCLFVSLFAPVTHAQMASISGTVTDQTGAVVPHTKVSARNDETGFSRSMETDDSGTYRVSSLSPGTYDVLIEKAGFKAVAFSRVKLSVDQVLTLDARLAPSAIAEKVTVSGESVAPVNLNDAQIGNVVSSQQISDLPLVLRNPYQLVLLSPGAVQSNSLLQGFSVNGSRERNNNFLLDGTDNNDAEIPGLSQPQPGLTSLNPDAVQEFRVLTNNFLPEFGRNTGAVIDIVSKRGTNDFQFDLYWFGRYDALGARDFFNHQLDSTGNPVPKDSYVRNTFGGSAGGPIKRDRTFWFANYEGERFATTLTNTTTVPSAAFKTGNLSFSGQPIDVSTQGSPNNIFGLPLDPTIQQILALYPSPNGPNVDDARGLLFYPSASTTIGNNVTAAVDHRFTVNENLAIRYTLNRFEDPNIAHTDFLPGLGGTGTLQRRQNASLHLTSILGQRLVNELRFGGNRINFPLTCQGLEVFDRFSQLDSFGRGLDFPLPGVSGFGCLFLVDRDNSKRFSGTYTLGDAVTWVKGQHTFKMGFEFRDVYSNSTNNFLSRTTLDFNNFSNFGVPAFQTGNPAVDSSATLQNMVWSLFGAVGSETQAQFFDKGGNRTADDLRGVRQQEFNAFLQDSYKILTNLTLSYGLRYQFNGVPSEVNNLLSTLFTSPSGSAPFTFQIAGEEHGLPPLYKNDWHDFEPRIGLAWDPFKHAKTSLRAGYGIFHDRVFGQLLGLTRGNPPFQQIFFAPLFNPISGGPAVTNLPLPPTLTATPVVNDGAGILPFLVDPRLRMPYSQSWNLGFQNELRPNLLIEVNYVASKGTRLLRLVDGNPPQPALVAQLEAFCVPSNPANQGFNTPSGQCDQTTLQFDNLWFGAETGLLPFDAVNNNAFLHAELYTNRASSIYHALQATVTRRLAHGLAVQAAYTWSHAIDNASDPLVPSTGNQEFPRNSFDLAAERGNSDYDVRQRLALNYTWNLPVGRGHKYFSEGVLGKILESWQFAGITTFSKGLPFDVFTDLDTAHTGEIQRADLNPSGALVPVTNLRTQSGPNLGLFSDPPFGREGNLGRNRFTGPGINNWDIVLQKTFTISERADLEFRTEAYNVFNRVQLSQPDNRTSDLSSFGQSTSEVRRSDGTSGARQIQMGVKIRF